jgi:hypothetical protein
VICALAFLVSLSAASAMAEMSATELAKLAQNPVGGGVGKTYHFGKLPVNMQLSGYFNAVTPDFGADWQIPAQVQFMFPK